MGPRFLIVEDAHILREQFARILRRFGDCVEAASMEEVEEHELGTWDGFVIDVQLPHRSGLELLERIRQEKLATPILLISGRMEGPIVNEASRLRARCLSKPFDIAELREFASEVIAARANDRKRRAVERARARWGLSVREAEILELAIMGHARDQICERARISANTYKTLVRRLLKKTGHENVPALALALLRED